MNMESLVDAEGLKSLDSFRLETGKVVGAQICCIEWSPTMDLLAYANKKGEVHVHRLSWQRLWQATPPCAKSRDSFENAVKALCWQPDGRTLAVGMADGGLHLYDVESGQAINEQPPCSGGISCLTWAWDIKAPKSISQFAQERGTRASEEAGVSGQPGIMTIFGREQRYARDFNVLPLLKDRNGGIVHSSVALDPHTIRDCDFLDVLAVGRDDGSVELYASGVLPIVRIASDSVMPCNLAISPDFSSVAALFYYCENSGYDHLRLDVFDTNVIARNKSDLIDVASFCKRTTALFNYITQTVACMERSWEDTFVSFGTRIEQFYETCVSDEHTVLEHELLGYLTKGVASEELNKFFLTVLNENETKRLAQSIDVAYQAVQQLGYENLETGAMALLQQVSDMVGFARASELPLDEQLWEDCILVVNAFLMKIEELLTVVGTSRSKYTVFFLWLYLSILHIKDLPIPSSFPLEDVSSSLVVEFLHEHLKNQITENESTQRKYFRNEHLKERPLTYATDQNSEYASYSLVELMNTVKQKLNSCFEAISDDLSSKLRVASRTVLTGGETTWLGTSRAQSDTRETPVYKSSQCDVGYWSSEGNKSVELVLTYAARMAHDDDETSTTDYLYTLSVDAKDILASSTQYKGFIQPIPATRFTGFGLPLNVLSQESSMYRVNAIDVKLYAPQHIAVLVQSHSSHSTEHDLKTEDVTNEIQSFLALLPIASETSSDRMCSILYSPEEGIKFINTTGECRKYLSTTDLIFGNECDKSAEMTGMISVGLAVSATRRLACVLDESEQFVRILALDEDEEEDEEVQTENEEDSE